MQIQAASLSGGLYILLTRRARLEALAVSLCIAEKSGTRPDSAENKLGFSSLASRRQPCLLGFLVKLRATFICE